MLYYLFGELSNYISVFNVFKYLTFRSILAAASSMLIWFVFGQAYINRVKKYQIKQFIREEGPKSHQKKSGTPTMGGIFIILACLIAALLWSNLQSSMVWAFVLILLSYSAIGFHDDFLKIKRKHNKGLSAKQKFITQTIFGLGVGLFLYLQPGFDLSLTVPVFKNIKIDLGVFYIPFAALVLVGTSNAVNLTDGLDGLAIGPVVIAIFTYMVFIYCAGSKTFAEYLQLTYVHGASDLTIVLAALVGSGLGFLWFNTYPAQIFMGDVGSLPLGAVLGFVALVAKQELLLLVVGGIFVVEALSVILQVSFFKLTKGRRIFSMAPLHHHFELKGWAEPKVIVRFWIIAIILAMVGLSTLKLR